MKLFTSDSLGGVRMKDGELVLCEWTQYYQAAYKRQVSSGDFHSRLVASRSYQLDELVGGESYFSDSPQDTDGRRYSAVRADHGLQMGCKGHILGIWEAYDLALMLNSAIGA